MIRNQLLWEGRMQQDIWRFDLTQCEPAESISRDGRPGTWTAVDYATDQGTGVMLFGLPGSGAPPLTLRLTLSGWYAIRMGIFYGASAGFIEDRVLCAKLSRDAACSRFGREDYRPVKDGDYPEKTLRWSDIAEVFWKCADLTGQDLIIARPSKGEMSKLETNLAYVRLTPMDEEALLEWQSEQPSAETKRLIANYDGGNFGQWGVSTREDFLAEFECMRDSDFDVALYAVAAGPITVYPSRVGEFVRPSGLWGHGHVLHLCASAGIDPLAEAIAAAHECGVKLFPQNRFEGPQVPPQHHLVDHGGLFMAAHPEWMCTYPDGEVTRHLSFAFSGVRDFYVQMMREWVQEYRADGVNLLFSRSYPFVYYEQPVCDEFQRQFGQSMLSLPPGDERAQQVRAGFLTLFLREIRAMLNEVGDAQGRRIPACYLVPVHNSPPNAPEQAHQSALAECLFNALDVAAWIREGLVDYLGVHLHVYGPHDGTAVQPAIREFTEMARGTATRVFVDVYPRRMPPRQYRAIAMSYYAAGADGLAFWDSFGRYYRASEWAFVRRLGHCHDLHRWQGKGDDYYRVTHLRRLDRFVMDREFSTPSNG
jgi:hypothetical protein